MTIFNRARNWLSKIIQSPLQRVGDMDQFNKWMDGLAGNNESVAGEVVTADTAMKIATVYACVKVLGESIGQLPMKLYEKQGDHLEEVTSHPLSSILKLAPNDSQTPSELKQTIMGYLCLHGRSYTQVVRDKIGRVMQLVIVDASDCQEIRLNDNGEEDPGGTLYVVYKAGTAQQTIIPADEFWRSKNFLGLSPITQMANTLGLDKAMEKSQGSLFQNGVNPSGVLEYPGRLKDKEMLERLRAQWQTTYSGAGNHHKPIILEGGMVWKQVSLLAKDVQFLESRRFQKEQICSAFRVPPHMVADLSAAKFANVEQQDLNFTKHSLMPYIIELEESATRDLLTEREREALTIKFNVNAMLRGDYKTRMEGYSLAILNGILSINEVRALENLPSVEGGEVPRTQMQMVEIGKVTDEEQGSSDSRVSTEPGQGE